MGLLLSVVSGCGGRPLSASRPDGGTGEGDAAVPLKNGVPIGTCVDTTPAELAAGCPSGPPGRDVPCNAPSTLRCRYPIDAADGVATQDFLICDTRGLNGRIWVGPRITCGRSCAFSPGEPFVLETTNCGSRPVISFRDDLMKGDAIYSEEWTTTQDLLDAEIDKVVLGCIKDLYGAHIEVGVQGGCPQRFTTSVPLDPSATACIQAALEKVRWDCAAPALWHLPAHSHLSREPRMHPD